MKSIQVLVLLSVTLLSTSAFAVLPETGMKSLASGTDTYRIGDEWGKKPVTTASLRDATPAFRRDALATARVGGATGFYLGKFNGYHVMATNHHVYEAAWNCLNNPVTFPMLGVTGTCVKFFGTWSEVDLSLFAIELRSADDEAKLAPVAGNFAFHHGLTAGEDLITIGFGIANNPNRLLMANQDSDCKVFSASGEYRKMGDPDSLNPGDYDAWSFANGCDVSHGDSGSAMVDRQTGEVMGIIWTGKIPKSEKVQHSSYLDQILASHDEAIWTELSYAVPAVKMGEVLEGVVQNDSSIDEATRATLKALLQ